MKLNKLITCSYETEITGIKIDSREVEKGDLFIAVKGFNIDHNLYIDDAIKKGAVAVISERNWKKSVPVIKVDNIEEALVEICKKFYNIYWFYLTTFYIFNYSIYYSWELII